MKTATGKAKGRQRKCRRCNEDYEPTLSLQKVCEDCKTKCSTCGTKLTEENQDRRSKEARKAFRCKSCVAKGVRETPGRKDWQKDYDLKRRYGISVEDFKNMSKDGCMLCNSSDKLVVDHCHETGVVRGVLCGKCNTGLGMFQDSYELLSKASKYLKEFK